MGKKITIINQMSHTLYIVATPIGNLADITLRALEVLKNVDLILVEDSRHSKKLLQHYDITTKTKALHEHNERESVDYILTLLQTQNIALISDAGTPLISDPGYVLVREAKKANITVVPIPGPSSVITALSAAGMPTNAFCFLGFIPTKEQAKKEFVQHLATSTQTSICFESPKRILATITLMQKIFDTTRELCLAKELTKSFETILCGTTAEILEFLTIDSVHQNGEFVLIISGNTHQNVHPQLMKLLPVLDKELPKTQAAKIAAKLTGLSKNECYEQLMKL